MQELIFTLLLPQTLLEQLVNASLKKAYLRERITIQEFETVVLLLSHLAEPIPSIVEKLPLLSRDPKDDYLLAYALVGQADYLVTGDADLLSFKKIDQAHIVSPREFVDILNNAKK